MPSKRIALGLSVILVIAAAFLPTVDYAASSDLIIYGNSLNPGWQNWSWDTITNFAATSPVHSGSSKSLAVTYTAAWAGLYLAAVPGVDSGPYYYLQFWINGGSQGSQKIRVLLADSSQNFISGSAVDVPVKADAWIQVKVLLTDLGQPAQIGAVIFQESAGASQTPTFYLDDVRFTTRPPPSSTGPNLEIDVSADRHAISEDIYGMNYADQNLATSLRLPVRRWGGNSTTRYNWQANIHNTGSDWYFENIPDGAPITDGSSSDLFVDQNRLTKTKTLLTVPLIGWTPLADSPRNHPYDCGYKVSIYGAQQSTDPYDTDCGNGVSSATGANITGNNPSDTSSPIGPDFVTGWVNHLTAKYGSAQSGGVAYYDLDNEPMLWNNTHRDVHPHPTTYDEMQSRTTQYAAAIKAADPTAKTLGPVLWGWCAYFYSALDGCSQGGSDYTNHNDTYFVPWYLQQMQLYDINNGVRILDYLDLHYYPAASGVTLSPAGNSATQALRLRCTRSLWDPSYIDESWISNTAQGGVAVELIPRMREWVEANYPGTKLAISEYNWGALDNINGALAQADVLGIFGREGLDLATLWSPPADTDPGAFAFAIYRNYDGNGSGFGDVSVQAVSADQGSLSVYAAQRSSDGSLTIIVINKTSGPLKSAAKLSGFNALPTAAVYQYSTAKLSAIVHAANMAVSKTGFNATFPGNSITLLVLMTPVAVSISPQSATVHLDNSQQFTANVTGTANTSVIWKVNGASGGNSSVGTISASGLYTAPAKVPKPAVVTVQAVSSADSSKSASAKVTIAK